MVRTVRSPSDQKSSSRPWWVLVRGSDDFFPAVGLCVFEMKYEKCRIADVVKNQVLHGRSSSSVERERVSEREREREHVCKRLK
jgi:hypothetical protein